MGAKFELILNKIHWSLLIKSIIVGVAWFFLPFWLFLILVLLFYFIPIFRQLDLLFQFLIFLFLAGFIPNSFWGFLFIVTSFFIILGIKDLIIIKRALAYEVLGILFFLVISLFLFKNLMDNFIFNFKTILGTFGLGLFYFLFFKNTTYFKEEQKFNHKNFKIGLALLSFLIWQFGLILSILPLSFYLQSAIVILVGVLGLEMILNYVFYGLNKQSILSLGLIFTLFFILILASADFSL